MFVVTGKDGTIIFPEISGQRTACPGCGSELVACCGEIVINHWRHLSGSDCDTWAETPGPWHKAWQLYLQSLGAKCEVHIQKNGETHRADAVLPNGTVVELQSSGISVPEIRKREAFYGDMIWVFDAGEAFDNERFVLRPTRKGTFHSFRWKQARKSVAYTKKPKRLCLGDGWVLNVKKMSKEAPIGGWGYFKKVQALKDYGV